MNHDLRMAGVGRTKWNRSLGLSFLLVTALATQASAETILIDDFNDDNGVPDGWTTIDSTVGQSYGPGTFDASSGAYHLQGAGLIHAGVPAGGALVSVWEQSSDPIFTDGFVRATIRAGTEGNKLSLALRENPGNAYVFAGNTNPANRQFQFNKFENGRVTRLLTLPEFPFGVNEDWIIEAGAVGDQLSMKVWRVGDPEPESPQLALTDRSFRTGGFGISANIAVDRPFPGPARVSATFDDIYFTFPPGVIPPGPCDESCTWASPMPIPQTSLPPVFPQNSPERSDLRGDVPAPDVWPELRITGQVTDFDGQPIPGLKLDFFHADLQGMFDTPDSSTLRGHQFTDSDGNYELWTITPGQFETLRTRLLHFFVGGENQGFESPVYRTEMFFPDPFDNDINADGTPDKAYIGGMPSDDDAIGIEDDFFVPGALSGAGAEFSDLTSNILTLNNDPLVEGFFDTSLNIVMPRVFQMPSHVLGDFDGDGQLSAVDIDLLSEAVGSGEMMFDLDGNGTVGEEDRRTWVEDVLGTFFGDADLNKEVEIADFLSLSDSFSAAGGWTEGDFDGSGVVQFADFLLLSTNFGKSAQAIAAVPEPSGSVLTLLCAFLLPWTRRRFHRRKPAMVEKLQPSRLFGHVNSARSRADLAWRDENLD